MLLAPHFRIDPADPFWPDRDRIFRAPDTTAPPGINPINVGGPAGLTAAAAVGAALAERVLAARFGRSLVDHRTWLLAGPAELAAGAMQEAAAVAGAVPLGRLTVVATLPAAEPPGLAHFAALGWTVRRVAPDDDRAADAAIATAIRAQKPTLIVTAASGTPASALPEDHPAVRRSAGARRAWLKRLRRHAGAEGFQRGLAGRPPPGWLEAMVCATTDTPRAAVRAALLRLLPLWPELAGLPPEAAAALAGRTTPHAPPWSLPWGDHAQAAAGGLLGMALHGGLVPIGLTHAAQADCLLPALRAAPRDGHALHLVLEDQAVPDGVLAAWRALPGTMLLRPADAAEAADCLAAALRHPGAAVLLLGDRAAAFPSEQPKGGAKGSAVRGGYVAHAEATRDLTLIASGMDLHLALAVRRNLAEHGVAVATVSLPCWGLFAAQDDVWRETVLGAAPRVALEAACGFGWTRWLGDTGLFIDTRDAGEPAAIALTIARWLRLR